MGVCSDCGGNVIQYDHAAGNGFCTSCGTVVEENAIVSEVTFGETSSGAAMVQGSYVGQGSTHARMSGPFGNRGTNESREQTIANASRKIQSLANVLRLSDVVCLAATRLYTLAVEHKFTKGRKSMNVVAVCLYVACRQKETKNYMLIDFSDLLQVNVFELGHTYLQLVQTLNLRLPLVDPSHYISRFAALLEFGEDTHKVASDAVRLIQRFDRDWMTKGRRPAGICGAALLLAARMNNFRRSTEEIVQVVKIADTTLRKRLEEFKKTPSGSMTIGDFRTAWLDDEMDPPAFIKGREREERELAKQQEDGEQDSRHGSAAPESPRKTKRKRAASDASTRAEDSQIRKNEKNVTEPPPIDPALLGEGILAGVMPSTATSLEAQTEELIDEVLLDAPSAVVDEMEEAVHQAVREEVSDFLTSAQSMELTSALQEAEQRRQASYIQDDDLQGLDEEELDQFILTEEEVRIKERVWVEMNRDYLEALALKAEQQEHDQANGGSGKVKKKRKHTPRESTKPRDLSTPTGSTAAESVKNMLKKSNKYSRRINYEAVKDMFLPEEDEKPVGGLFIMDDEDLDPVSDAERLHWEAETDDLYQQEV